MDTGISVELFAPCGWQVGQHAVADDAKLLLRVLAILESAQPGVEEAMRPDDQHWQALEARVDLCLHLLSELLSAQSPPPPAVPISLSCEGARFISPHPLTPGERGVWSVWLADRLAKALRLDTVVETCQPHPQGYQLQVRFVIDDEALQDWVDKTVFRRHRREIQRIRKAEHGI